MPAAVERCVESLLSKWDSDPSSRPTPQEEGQDAKSQAFAICQAAHKKAEMDAQDAMLLEGYGPTLIGVAATNRPFIPNLTPIEVVGEEDDKRFICHLATPGLFNHPRGRFVLNRQVFSAMIANFTSHVFGQDVALDTRHRPDLGSLAWFDRLYIKDGKLFGEAVPTPKGLEVVGNKEYRYCSMEFHKNFNRDDVKLDLESATEEFCLTDDEVSMCIISTEGQQPEEDKMAENEKENTEVTELELKLGKMESAVADAERRAKEAEEKVLQLQRTTLNEWIERIVRLAKTYRDSEGNAHPAPLIAWAEKILRFEDIGEGEGVVKLSSETPTLLEMRQYIIGAVDQLLTSLPGVVPLQRKTQDQPGDKDKDNFDYDGEWKKDE